MYDLAIKKRGDKLVVEKVPRQESAPKLGRTAAGVAVRDVDPFEGIGLFMQQSCIVSFGVAVAAAFVLTAAEVWNGGPMGTYTKYANELFGNLSLVGIGDF